MGVDLPPDGPPAPLESRPFLPDDTIVALSTPTGRGGLGVVRLSGSDAAAIAGRLIRLAPGSGKEFPKSHRAAVAELVDQDDRAVDQIVVTFFQKPRSYTAEDVVELSCHGSPVVLALAIERAIELGARLAEPGEFTQRAFLNGRIDLAQAEAVRDLIEATTLYQARVAVQQVEGSLSRRLSPIKKQLCDLIALLEAGIDFAEDDISYIALEEVEFDERSDVWRITLSFLRPTGTINKLDLIAPGLSRGENVQRSYKIVNVDDQSGRVISVKHRVLKAAD